MKYSERTGKPISYSGGQVSKQSLKRIKEATKTTEREKNEENARKAKERKKFQSAQKKAVPQIVTDRMLSRVVRFSGIPMVLGFTTGPTYYYFAKINTQEWLEPWMFFAASTATFGLAFVVLSLGGRFLVLLLSMLLVLLLVLRMVLPLVTVSYTHLTLPTNREV